MKLSTIKTPKAQYRAVVLGTIRNTKVIVGTSQDVIAVQVPEAGTTVEPVAELNPELIPEYNEAILNSYLDLGAKQLLLDTYDLDLSTPIGVVEEIEPPLESASWSHVPMSQWAKEQGGQVYVRVVSGFYLVITVAS